MRIIFLFLMAVSLSACAGHETLKAPCTPIADGTESPCKRFPLNQDSLLREQDGKI